MVDDYAVIYAHFFLWDWVHAGTNEQPQCNVPQR
jgi:hypothetical protein